MNPFDQMRREVRKLHHLRATTGKLITYSSPTDSDPWEDESWTKNSEIIDIYVRRSETASRARRGGIEIEEDVVIFVDPTEIDSNLSDGTEGRPSEIVDESDPFDQRYDVVRIDNDQSGVWMLQAKRSS